jgi:hypothetical protein
MSEEEREEDRRPAGKVLREAAAAYRAERPGLRVVGGRPEGEAEGRGERSAKMKTSVYLERRDVERLAWLSEVEGRPQAEIIREAIRAYEPKVEERTFLFFGTGEGDGRSFADFSEEEIEELMRGFGADSFGDADR